MKSYLGVFRRELILPAILCLHSASLCADDLGEHAADPIVMIGGNLGGTATFGAGIIFGREKDRFHIVTANHVVRSGGIAASNLSARLRIAPNKNLPATLAQFDPVLDLAVLSVDNLAAQGIDVCSLQLDRLAVPGTAKRGDSVYPVGNPNGVPWTMPVRPDAISEVSEDSIVFQSTLIARGHSGGGILNTSGQLVGMIQADEPPYGRALSIHKILQILNTWNYSTDLNVQNENGDPPLITAVSSVQIEEIKRLLRQTCVDPNAKSTEFGYSALELAARRGSVEEVKLLIDAGADLKTKGHDHSIISSAAYGGSAEIVRLLVSRGAPCCGTALHTAASRGNLEVVRALLESGAKPNAKSGGRTVFYYALNPWSMSKNRAAPEEIVQTLIQAGADVNSADFDGETPLVTAVSNRQLASSKLLLLAGANVNVAGRDKRTVLDLIGERSGSDDDEIVALLVSSASRVDPEIGSKLLGRATTEGWTDVADLLIKHGVNVKGKAGGEPLWNATMNGRVEIVKLLLQAGADPNASSRTSVPLGSTPLVSLLGDDWSSSELAKNPSVRLEIVKLLVLKGAKLTNPADATWLGPLYLALFKFNPPDLDVAGFLIAHGANVNGRDSSECSYLHIARKNKDQRVVNFLLQHGARDLSSTCQAN